MSNIAAQKNRPITDLLQVFFLGEKSRILDVGNLGLGPDFRLPI